MIPEAFCEEGKEEVGEGETHRVDYCLVIFNMCQQSSSIKRCPDRRLSQEADTCVRLNMHGGRARGTRGWQSSRPVEAALV